MTAVGSGKADTIGAMGHSWICSGHSVVIHLSTLVAALRPAQASLIGQVLTQFCQIAVAEGFQSFELAVPRCALTSQQGETWKAAQEARKGRPGGLLH